MKTLSWYIEFYSYVFSLSLVGVVLIRHSLLNSRRLDAHSVTSNECVVALFGCLKSLCKAQAEAEPRSSAEENDNVSVHRTLGHKCTFCVLIFYFLWTLNVLVSYASQSLLELLPFSYGTAAIVVSSLLYTFAKSSMYVVFVARLYSGFQGTFVACSTGTILALYALVALYTSLMCALVANFAMEGHTYHHSDRGMPLTIALYFLTFDVLYTFVIVCMFYSAMNRMLKNLVTGVDARTVAANRNISPELYLLPMKYTFISALAAFTTLLSLGIATASGVWILMPLDCIINSLCIVLMTNSWIPIYTVICTPALKCVITLPCVPCGDVTDTQLMDLFVNRIVGDMIDYNVRTQAAAATARATALAVGHTAVAPTQALAQTQVATATVQSDGSDSDLR